MVYDGYVKYEEAEIHSSAIMEDYEIKKKKKKKLKWLNGGHFIFFSVNFVMGYPCVRHYILFYIHGQVILHFLS